MADEATLNVEIRTSFGKGAARKIRAADKIPAVLYGHGTEPVHLTLPGHQTMLLTRKANAVLNLSIEGSNQLALVKDVQTDPVRRIIEHIDLVIVKKGEKVTVDVPVHVEGESGPGTIHVQETTSISVEVEATHIPESVSVSIEGLEEGSQVTAADVELPKGATLLSDGETLIVNVTVPAAPVEDEDEAAEGEEADEAPAADADADAE
ncbi:50S ribosomal protein L25/general stress protein Ctc [Arenivirga flava]|uniref:Large ribosomal subunit protein bL25 n=1 Tax=Arenivirga flava TaxID=1930060 RepID=A0AA37XB24_9MICO|nr:50S ribosomal protein L25/general stress protein Ctc [Arenivirga flava]GMA28273.1 50S ribosomal protein L25 [Arenivirga flava]